jgi:hypothetical protein
LAYGSLWRLSVLSLQDVSPLRGAGLLRFASSRCQRPNVSPLTGGHPSLYERPPIAKTFSCSD